MDGFDLEFTWIIILMVYIDNLNWGFTHRLLVFMLPVLHCCGNMKVKCFFANLAAAVQMTTNLQFAFGLPSLQ
jgi:predicted ferric reductase